MPGSRRRPGADHRRRPARFPQMIPDAKGRTSARRTGGTSRSARPRSGRRGSCRGTLMTKSAPRSLSDTNTFRLDESVAPHAIDLFEPGKEEPVKGLFEFRGGKLMICVPDGPEKPRPRTIDAKGYGVEDRTDTLQRRRRDDETRARVIAHLAEDRDVLHALALSGSPDPRRGYSSRTIRRNGYPHFPGGWHTVRRPGAWAIDPRGVATVSRGHAGRPGAA